MIREVRTIMTKNGEMMAISENAGALLKFFETKNPAVRTIISNSNRKRIFLVSGFTF